jgi:enterochelin esterase-like enzyme
MLQAEKRSAGSRKAWLRSLGAMALMLCAEPSWSQANTGSPPAQPGAPTLTVERIKVHGRSLEGNLEGESADRTVLVILPPNYARQPGRRFPVLYALHGYSIGAEQWTQEIHAPATVANAYAKGLPDMIIVMPDAKTVHNGSMYSSSVTPAISSPTWTRITGRSPIASAEASPATRWAAMAPAGSA